MAWARPIERLAALPSELIVESLAEEECNDTSAARNVGPSSALWNRDCGMHAAAARQELPGAWHVNVEMLTGVASPVTFADEWRW